MKKLAVAAGAGLMLLAVSAAVVLAGQAPGSSLSGVHVSAARDSQESVSPSQVVEQSQSATGEQSEAAEDQQGDADEQGDENQQGNDEQGTAGQPEP